MVNFLKEWKWHVLSCVFSVVVVTPLYLWLGDYSRVAITEQTRIFPEEVYRGQEVSVLWRIKTLRGGCQGSVARIVEKLPSDPSEPTQRFFYPDVEIPYRAEPNPEWVEVARDIKIPLFISPGKADMHIDVTRWCNPWQSFFPIREARRTIPFTVLDQGD